MPEHAGHTASPPASRRVAGGWPAIPDPPVVPGASSAPAPPVVPAPALPAWPRPTNPVAPGSRSATARPDGRPTDTRVENRIPDRPEGRVDNPGPPAYTLPAVPPTNSPSHGAPGPPAAVAPPNSPPVATSAEYHQWARNQRPQGTTYTGQGGTGVGQMTMTIGGAGHLETSGSLTGHILSQGGADRPTPKTRTAKVIVIGLVLLGVLVLFGLVAAAFANDFMGGIFDGIIKGD